VAPIVAGYPPVALIAVVSAVASVGAVQSRRATRSAGGCVKIVAAVVAGTVPSLPAAVGAVLTRPEVGPTAVVVGITGQGVEAAFRRRIRFPVQEIAYLTILGAGCLCRLLRRCCLRAGDWGAFGAAEERKNNEQGRSKSGKEPSTRDGRRTTGSERCHSPHVPPAFLSWRVGPCTLRDCHDSHPPCGTLRSCLRS